MHREPSKGSDAGSYKSQASRGNKFVASKDAMAGSGFNIAAGTNRVPSDRSAKQSTHSPNTGLAGTKYAESPSRLHTSKFEEASPQIIDLSNKKEAVSDRELDGNNVQMSYQINYDSVPAEDKHITKVEESYKRIESSGIDSEAKRELERELTGAIEQFSDA